MKLRDKAGSSRSVLVRRILFATDFSEPSDQALRFAAFLAKGFKARLELVHVLEFHPGMNQKSPVARIYLEELRKESDQKFTQLKKTLKAQSKLSACPQVVGAPPDQINELASERRADLVVIGTHGWTGINHVLLGSTAERVVRGAPCPVITVRWKGISESDRKSKPRKLSKHDIPKLKQILVPLDFSSCSLQAFDYAVKFAKHFKASVVLLHVMETHPYGSDFIFKEKISRDLVEKKLTELVSLIQSNGLDSLHELREGSPSNVILARTSEINPDLVIMGTHGRRGFSHLVNGSVAEAVLRRATCPVLTVKNPQFIYGFRQWVPGESL